MKKINMILAVSAITSSLMAGEVYAADPTAVNVTAYKTEVCTDTACSTILDDTAGVAAELVSGTGAFGSNPSVATGSYNRFRFTLKNEISMTGSPGGTCAAGATTTTLIDSSLAPTAQVTVAFATADAAPPGSTGWYANGSDAHPFIMSTPVVVSADGTTNVTIQFNTAATLSCNTGVAEIAAPSFDVSSYELPSAAVAADFTGGDYWLMGTNVHNPWLRAESLITANSLIPAASWPPADILLGQMIEPGIASDGSSIYQALLNSADAAKYQAQIRARTTREVLWGMKVRLGAPSTIGEGSVSLIRDQGWQQFAPVFSAGSESFLAASIIDATPALEGTYNLDSHNRLTLYMDGSVHQGALSDDYETIVVGETSDGTGLSMGVKVATGRVALPNKVYSWNSYMVEIWRNDDPTNTKGSNGIGIDGDEVLSSFYQGSVGWVDATNHLSATFVGIGTIQELQNPDLTTFTSNNFLNDEGETSQDFSSILSGFVDGAGVVGPGLESWIAVSPSGQVGLMTGAEEFDLRFSDDAYVGSTGNTDPGLDFYVRKSANFTVLVQLAATGTHTMANLAGTYFISSVWDSLDAGNSSFGGSVTELTLNADGTGTVNTTDVDNLNRISGGISTIGWEILNFCIGIIEAPVNVFTRMDVNSATCVADGGKIVDAIVAYDPATPTQHQMAIFPSADGKALTFFDPQLDLTQTSRSLGLGVKLR